MSAIVIGDIPVVTCPECGAVNNVNLHFMVWASARYVNPNNQEWPTWDFGDVEGPVKEMVCAECEYVFTEDEAQQVENILDGDVFPYVVVPRSRDEGGEAMTYTEGEMEQAQIEHAYEFDLPVVMVNGYYQVDRSGRKRGEDMGFAEDINRVALHVAMLVYERYQEDGATAYREGKQELIQEWFDGDNENLLENALSMMDLSNQAVFRRIIEALHPECQAREYILHDLDAWGIR